jgi:hypothetical protein
MLVRRAAGKLFLRVVFRPVRSQLRNQACQWVSGGRVVRLEADVEAVALIDRDGRTLSRGGSRDATLELDTPVTGPVVTARRPRLADGGDVSDALAEAVNELAGAALPCYQKALAARPNLRGTMVVGLRVAGDGRIDAPRMEMSTLGDDALTACVTSRLGKARLAGGPARISLPLVFGSKDDR